MSRAERETARVSELALTFFDAFNRGGTDAADQYLAPDVISYSAPGWAGDPVYEGIPRARAARFTVHPEADKITEIRFFFSWEEALEVAGIER